MASSVGGQPPGEDTSQGATIEMSSLHRLVRQEVRLQLEVATRADLDRLERHLNQRIDDRIGGLNQRISDLYKWLFAVVVPTALAVLGKIVADFLGQRGP